MTKHPKCKHGYLNFHVNLFPVSQTAFSGLIIQSETSHPQLKLKVRPLKLYIHIWTYRNLLFTNTVPRWAGRDSPTHTLKLILDTNAC